MNYVCDSLFLLITCSDTRDRRTFYPRCPLCVLGLLSFCRAHLVCQKFRGLETVLLFSGLLFRRIFPDQCRFELDFCLSFFGFSLFSLCLNIKMISGSLKLNWSSKKAVMELSSKSMVLLPVHLFPNSTF